MTAAEVMPPPIALPLVTLLRGFEPEQLAALSVALLEQNPFLMRQHLSYPFQQAALAIARPALLYTDPCALPDLEDPLQRRQEALAGLTFDDLILELEKHLFDLLGPAARVIANEAVLFQHFDNAGYETQFIIPDVYSPEEEMAICDLLEKRIGKVSCLCIYSRMDIPSAKRCPATTISNDEAPVAEILTELRNSLGAL